MTANKIYSINLAAFIYLVGKVEPMLAKDANNQVYFIFPDTPEINLIISVYRRNKVSVDLKDYLAAYRYTRTLVRAFK